MVIRQEQIDVFTAKAHELFVDRLVQYLRLAHGGIPVETPAAVVPLGSLSEDKLLGMVRQCVDTGRGWGLLWETSLASLTILMFLQGPRFYEHALIRSEMENPAIPQESLVDHLAIVVPAKVWQEASVEYRGGWRS